MRDALDKVARLLVTGWSVQHLVVLSPVQREALIKAIELTLRSVRDEERTTYREMLAGAADMCQQQGLNEAAKVVRAIIESDREATP